MILVDIFVPAMNQTYDFKLDENGKSEEVIEEISAMICQKEQCIMAGNQKELILCLEDAGRVIQAKETLKEAGAATGKRLILV